MSADPAPATTTPRWLDDEEQRTWRSFWLAVRLLSESFERDLQREEGLSMSYYEILVRLSEAPDRTLRMSELARSSQVSRSALSHAVARLEASGWVDRRDCPTDRRGALATLTDAGFARLERAAPAHVESVRRHLFDQLDETDLAPLRTISEKLVAQFEDEGACPPARLRGDRGATLAEYAVLVAVIIVVVIAATTVLAAQAPH